MLPTAHRYRRFLPVLLFIVFLCLPAAGNASAFPGHPPVDPHGVKASLTQGPIDLTSSWLVAAGDDPSYADPHLDDSHWLVANADEPLGKKGITDAVWYRTHVSVPPGTHSLAVQLQEFDGSQEVFANGVRIGGHGVMKPGGERRLTLSDVYPIPDSAVGSGDIVIAVRARIGAMSNFGRSAAGIHAVHPGGVFLGPESELWAHRTLFLFRDFTSNSTNLVLEVILFLIAVALAIALRGEREYLALSVTTAAVIANDILQILTVTGTMTYSAGYIVLRSAITVVQALSLLEFVRIVLGYRRTRLVRAYYWIFGIVGIASNPIYLFSLGHALSTWLLPVLYTLSVLVNIPMGLGLPFICLWTWWRRHNPDGLLLSIPFFLSAAYSYYDDARYLLFLFHITKQYQASAPPISAIYTQWPEITQFLFSIALLVFLVLRTVRIAKERAISAAEVRAVQTLQQLLLSRATQATPGYLVETAYRPASEVGGDFFLVSPNSDGSIIVIVGDVSGKGLLAAMRVSLILGALNRESAREPAKILENLNEALLSQGDVGFTTACCLRLERDGDFQFANAGHLNPYLDGRELESAGALPLGIRKDQRYATVTGHIEHEERIVLLSDGVPEARTRRGQLYGFEKLVELTLLPAETIADTAQTFGQEDDITVLVLALEQRAA